jgi:hypothetical protein
VPLRWRFGSWWGALPGAVLGRAQDRDLLNLRGATNRAREIWSAVSEVHGLVFKNLVHFIANRERCPIGA